MRIPPFALALTVSTLALVAPRAQAQNPRVRIAIIGHPGPVAIDSLASIVTINAPRAVVFHQAAQVFAELKVQVDARDSLRGMVGVTGSQTMRRFAGRPISRWLNCGSGITGLNADNWRVYITAYAFADAADSASTTLRLAMVGGAQDVQGNSTQPVACGSTGAFESMVADKIKSRIAQGLP
ncbi:MAG TPA: hypothetical protein VFV33_17730 [Gemmatimonadaceae bacterium]|nr:hypothetical protein [Gemmatimonadaceae bacterium]